MNSSFIGLATSSASSPDFQLQQLAIIAGEVVAITLVLLLEMKYKILSRLLGNAIAKLVILGGFLLAVVVLAILALGVIDAAIVLGAWILILGGLYFYFKKLAGAAQLAAIMIMMIGILAYLILSPAGTLIANNPLHLLYEIALPVGLFIFVSVTAYNLGHKKYLKATMNCVCIASTGIIAIYFGLYLNTYICLAILIVMAVYDLVAVFWLHTMQFMGQKMVKETLPSFLILGDEKELQQRLAAMNNPKTTTSSQSTKARNSALLGNGDLILPAILISSAVFYSPSLAPFLLGGAIAGMILNAILLQTDWKITRRGIPAIPLICICMSIAFCIGLFT